MHTHSQENPNLPLNVKKIINIFFCFFMESLANKKDTYKALAGKGWYMIYPMKNKLPIMRMRIKLDDRQNIQHRGPHICCLEDRMQNAKNIHYNPGQQLSTLKNNKQN